MTRLVVDLDGLADLVDRMQLFADQLARTRDDADQRVAHLHLRWTGEAADQQAQAHQAWAHAASELQAALVVLRSIATTAHGNYASASAANRRMWAR